MVSRGAVIHLCRRLLRQLNESQEVSELDHDSSQHTNLYQTRTIVSHYAHSLHFYCLFTTIVIILCKWFSSSLSCMKARRSQLWQYVRTCISENKQSDHAITSSKILQNYVWYLESAHTHRVNYNYLSIHNTTERSVCGELYQLLL